MHLNSECLSLKKILPAWESSQNVTVTVAEMANMSMILHSQPVLKANTSDEEEKTANDNAVNEGLATMESQLPTEGVTVANDATKPFKQMALHVSAVTACCT